MCRGLVADLVASAPPPSFLRLLHDLYSDPHLQGQHAGVPAALSLDPRKPDARCRGVADERQHVFGVEGADIDIERDRVDVRHRSSLKEFGLHPVEGVLVVEAGDAATVEQSEPDWVGERVTKGS